MSITGKAKNLKIAYIGGGSRGWAWGFMMDLAMDEALCGAVHLYDIGAMRSSAARSAPIRTPNPAGSMWWRIPFRRR